MILTQNVEEILKVNLYHMIYFCTLTIVYFEYDVLKYYRTTKET